MEQDKALSGNLININSNKAAKLFSLTFMCLTFAYLFPRGLATTTTPGVSSITNAISLYQAIPLIIISMFAEYNKTANKLINKIITRKNIYALSYLIISIVILLTLTGNTIFYWWTWFSFGLMIAITMFAMSIINIPSVDAFMLGAGIATLWRGFWEIPYQIGLKLIYDAPQISKPLLNSLIRYEIAAELPLIIGGVVLIWFYTSKHKLFNFNKHAVSFLLIYLVATILWFTNGLWVEIHYDWEASKWIAMDNINYSAMATYKFSKVALALGFVYLNYRKEKTRN